MCELFRGTETEKLEQYSLLERLSEEQCEVVEDKEHPSSDDDDHDQGGVPVELTDSCSSDAHATVRTVTALAERGIQPEELVADTTYGETTPWPWSAWAPS